MISSDLDRGLSAGEARVRLEKHGPNQLAQKEGEGPFRLFLRQFENFIIWVLVAAALVSGFLKEWVDTIAILAIVVVNAVLGFIQEYRAEKSLAALRKLSSPNSKVVRDGQSRLIPSSELVPGDIIELEAGDHVPAFSQDFHSYNCRNQVRSLFSIGLFTNTPLIGATLVSMALNGMAIYSPFFQKILKTQALTWPELFIVIAIASTPFWVMELYKQIRRGREGEV